MAFEFAKPARIAPPEHASIPWVELMLLVVAWLGWVEAGPVWARQTQEAEGKVVAAPGPRVGDLSVRYRFVETYLPAIGAELDLDARPANRINPETSVGKYKVGIRRVLKQIDEKGRGTPDRFETSEHIIYDEQPFELDVNDKVASVIRRYEKYELKSAQEEEGVKIHDGNPPLSGLVVYLKYPRNPGRPPEVICLSEGRRITQYEYNLMEEDIFVPSLRYLLPPRPIHIGEDWPVPDWVGLMLIGENDPPVATAEAEPKPGAAGGPAKEKNEKGKKRAGEPRDRETAAKPPVPPHQGRRSPSSFRATLVRLEGKTPKSLAVIRVEGTVDNGDQDRTKMAADLTFEFTPDPIVPAVEGEAVEPPQVLICRGAITKIRMGKTHTIPSPDPRERTKSIVSWELSLDRRVAEVNVQLPTLDAPPKATPANSWIALADDSDQFRLLHSQKFRLSVLNPRESMVVLWHYPSTSLSGLAPDSVGMRLTLEAPRPDAVRAERIQSWKTNLHVESAVGEIERLPAADWPGREAYHFEALLKIPEPQQGSPARLHFDSYIIQFSRNATLIVEVLSPNISAGAMRNEVENMLKTFEIGPGWNQRGSHLAPKGPTGSAPARPSKPSTPNPNPPKPKGAAGNIDKSAANSRGINK